MNTLNPGRLQEVTHEASGIARNLFPMARHLPLTQRLASGNKEAVGHYAASFPTYRAEMARRIRFLRQRAGIRPAELARRVGIHPSAVMRWERGESTPENPEQVALALGLSSLAEFYVVSVPADVDEE